jgi:hypothetical protein
LCLFIGVILMIQPIYHIFHSIQLTKYSLAEKFIKPKEFKEKHEKIWKKIENFKNLNTFDKWSAGLLGKSINNSGSKCKIPQGKWDFNFYVTKIKLTKETNF